MYKWRSHPGVVFSLYFGVPSYSYPKVGEGKESIWSLEQSKEQYKERVVIYVCWVLSTILITKNSKVLFQ